MPDPANPPPGAGAVREMALLLGWTELDPESAARIAQGAANAVAAVAARRRASLFDTEPGDFVATLESLADPEPGA